jgi:hypothetical protein
MAQRRHVVITDFLTETEIQKATELYKKLSGTGKYAATVDAEIIAPNIERINRALGQENDSRYLAYAVEFVMMGLK